MTVTPEQLASAAFPHPTRDIRVCETHLSLVVLTGDFAYKIKKAVHLDFIDTTSLDRRHELCQAELRLNRRYASELYLQVVPIAMAEQRLCFGAGGQPIEYAVQMRQFDRNAELQALLDNNAVEIEDLSRLAERVADFHLRANVYDKPFPAGSDAYLVKARENVASVLRRADLVGAADEASALERWTELNLASQLSLLHTRERRGWVRECHGDLHTGNVVRWRDALMPFDCIEFDAELRFIDVLNDAAFLTMDLLDRNRAELAFAFLNRYLERTGDYEGVPLVPSYLVYRALVRTKVELISLEQHSESATARERARSLLQTALGITRPPTPTLIVMHGASGSGKSWLSERLVPRLPALRIRSDLERKRLAGLDPFEPVEAPDERIYTLEFNERTYDHLLECARGCLRAGINAIVDAAFLKAHERRAFARLASDENGRLLIVSCHAERRTLATRIAQRRAASHDPSDADERVMERQLDTMERIAPDELAYTIHINTEDADALTRVLQRLRQ